jgi:ABC-type bacteriocin/lantibiotic exporter with double-glycine peptidase domain
MKALAGRRGSIESVRRLYAYVWSISARDQVILSALAVVAFLLELAPLELQRRIVNDAVGHQPFKFIAVLCLLYLALVIVQGGTKLVLNVYRGSVSERASRRLRLEPGLLAIAKSGKDGASEDEGVAISIVVSEVDAVGGFVGTSFSEPVLNGGIMLSVFGYMLFLQPWLALVAMVLLIPQFFFIPVLQEAINRRTEKRIKTARALAVEIVDGKSAQAEAGQPTYRRRVGDIYRLNMQIYRRKFGMTFLMNLIHQLGVIGILFVGSLLLIRGQTEVGTVVAFISGLTRTNDPWNDLVTYFRDLTNAGVKFRLIEQAIRKDSGAPA